MIRSKVQVDAHVSNVSKQLTKQEKLVRGFQFAKLYYSVKAFDKAEEYLLGFLTVKDNYGPAYELLGEIYEATCSDVHKVVEAYKKCLNADPKNKDVLLKICKLYSSADISPDLAKFWAKKAEEFFPSDDVVYRLKIKAQEGLVENTSNSNNACDMVDFYKAEAAKFPRDLMRRVKLLKFYMFVGRVEEAYKDVLDVETNHPHFDTSFEWCKCAVEVLSEYKKSKQEEKMSSSFYECYLFAINLLTSLSIGHSFSISNATDALWCLDRELTKFSESVSSSGTSKITEPLKVLLREIEAQYLFHCAVLILNKAQKENLSWRTAPDLSYACFLASMSRSPPDLTGAWFTEASDSKKKFYQRWHQVACFRCSQIGHMLRRKRNSQGNGSQWLKKLQEGYLNQTGRSRICQVLFLQSQAKEQMDKSFLFKTSLFTSPPMIPSVADVSEWDGIVQLAQPDNIACLVWICLHYYLDADGVQPQYPFVLFPDLSFSTSRVDSASPETLCQLDIQTFLMATVRCSFLSHHERCKLQDTNKPFLLPLSINTTLCSPAQIDWWGALNKLYSSSLGMDKLGQNRLILQQGIEVVRLIGNHGMDVPLVVHLARTWSSRLQLKKCQLDSTLEYCEDDSYLESHALHFWNKAVNMIEKLLNKQSIVLPKVCLFECRDSKPHISEDTLRKFLNEGKLFQGLHLKRNKEFTEALKLLSSIKSAESCYQAALIFKEFNDENISSSFDEAYDANKSNHINMLKAKHSLKDALELVDDNDSELFKKITNELDDIEVKLINMQTFKEYDTTSEFNDDCTSFGVTKLCYTPQKSSPHVLEKSGFMTSSTPFSKMNSVNNTPKTQVQSSLNFDKLEILINSQTHYVDQRFKSVLEENHKLLERIIVLENRVVSLESQKLMWMPTMPLNQMMPAPHTQVQFFPGGQLKHIPDAEFGNRFPAPMMMENKFNQVVHPNVSTLQPGMMLPGLNQMHSAPALRQNFPPVNHDVLKSHQPMNSQLAGSFLPAPGVHEHDDERSLSECMMYKGTNQYEGLLPSIEPNFFARHPPPPANINHNYNLSVLKPNVPLNQGLTPSAMPSIAPGSNIKTMVTVSMPQISTSNSPLAKLLAGSSSAPVAKKVTSQQFEINLTKSMSPKNVLPATRTTTPEISKAQTTSDKIKNEKTPNENPATSKTVLGGLIFNSTPIVKQTDNIPAPKVTPTDSNPFSNFSFGNVGSTFKSQFNFSLPKDAAAAAAPEASPTKVKQPDVGSPQTIVLNKSEGKDKNDESIEEFEPVGDFKPLVSLPIVNMLTGEEDDDKLFGEKGKLYRMDPSLKQWKERGVGEIKILQNKMNKKFRILMRREQVLKVCANHYITLDMKLMDMASSENSCCWFAQDFAEEEMKEEQFCIRFKTKEIAAAFKDCFVSIQKKLPSTNESSDKPTKPVSSTNSIKPLTELFKSAPGQWKCKSCYVSNKPQDLKCLACEEPHEGGSTSVSQASGNEAKPSISLFDLFKPKDGEWPCTACYVRNTPNATKCVSCESLKPGTQCDSSAQGKTCESKVHFVTQGGFQFGQKSNSQPVSFASMFGNSTPINISSGGFTPSVNVGSGESWTDKFGQVTTAVPSVTSNNTSVNKFNVDNLITTSAGSSSSSSSNIFSLALKTTEANATPKFVFGSTMPSASFNFPSLTPSTTSASSTFSFIKAISFTNEPPVAIDNNKPLKVTNTGETLELKNLVSAGDAKSPNSLFAFTGMSTFTFGKSDLQNSEETNKPPSSESSEFATPDKKSTGNFGSPKLSTTSAAISFGTPTFTFAGISNKVTEDNDDLKTPVKNFMNATPQSPQSPENEMYKNCEGEDDHILFEPIVKLPESYDTKTGEEDEQILFCEHAKLFRFQKNEWKERGVGAIKLLKNPKDGRIRVLMRREKILKICCNHYVCADMQLLPMPHSNNKAWVWHANDYADGNPSHDQLCIKFKSQEQTMQFKKSFEEVVESLKDNKELITSKADDEDCLITHVQEPSSNFVSEADRWKLPKNFYNYLNVPDCPGCIGCNDENFDFSQINSQGTVEKKKFETDQTLSVQAFISSHSDTKLTSTVTATSSSVPSSTSFSWMSTKPSLFGFDSLKNSTLPLENTASSGASTVSQAPPKLFGSFQANIGVVPSPTSTSQPIFGSMSHVLDFSTVSSANMGFKSESNFSWRGAGERLFTSSVSSERSRDEKEENVDEVEPSLADDVHFEPIVILPEVELKTGEEDEDEEYKQRSSLYRFDNNQWKERGVGDMKILKNKNTGAYRLLFRRDQVHKVACNHLLTPDSGFKKMTTSEKSWCWWANDFSDGEARLEQFALRFKTADLANGFKEAIDSCFAASSVSEDKEQIKSLKTTKERVKELEKSDDVGNCEEDGCDEENTDTVLFEKRAHLTDVGLVTVTFVEDPDVFGYRIKMVSDDHTNVCNHIICKGYQLHWPQDEKNKMHSCSWSAVDYSTDDPSRKTFLIRFSSQNSLDEFIEFFNKGCELAEEQDLTETQDEFDLEQALDGDDDSYDDGDDA